MRRVDWSKWRPLVIVGLCGSGIPAFLFPMAQMNISSSVTGVLNSLTPLFTLLLGLLFFGRKFRAIKLLGVFIGLAGATLLILMGNEGGFGSNNIWYASLAVLATVCYATSVNTVGSHLSGMSSLTISAISFVIVGFPAMIYLFTTDFVEVLTHHEEGYTAFFYIALLALAGTVLASFIVFSAGALDHSGFCFFGCLCDPAFCHGVGVPGRGGCHHFSFHQCWVDFIRVVFDSGGMMLLGCVTNMGGAMRQCFCFDEVVLEALCASAFVLMK